MPVILNQAKSMSNLPFRSESRGKSPDAIISGRETGKLNKAELQAAPK